MERKISQIVEDTIKQYTKAIISEGVESKNMAAAKHYLYDNAGMDEKTALKIIGAIKTDIPNSRLAKCKYMLAIARMFLNKELADQTTIAQVNQMLKYAASKAHVDEYDRNLNGLSAQELINRFKSFAEQETEQDKQRLGQQQYDQEKSNYDIVKIRSFEESSQYAKYTTWCVTRYTEMWDSYTAGGERPFYFCLRKDFKTTKKEETENCPLDNYGLSMVAVSVNPDGSPNTITCRWNDDHGGNDTVMTPEQLSNIINRNFYEAFPPNTPEEIEKARRLCLEKIQNEVLERLQYGKDNFEGVEGTENLYGDYDDDYYGEKEYGRYIYTTDDEKSVLVDPDGEILGDEWFDWISNDPVHGINRTKYAIQVERGGKENAIDINGNLISDTWFKKVRRMGKHQLFIVTRDDSLENIMDIDGKLMLKKWHEGITDGKLGGWLAVVKDGDDKFVIDIITEQPMFNKPVQDIRQLYFNGSRDEDYFAPIAVKMKGKNWYEIYDHKGERLIAPWHLQDFGKLTYGFIDGGDRWKDVIEVYDEDGTQLFIDKNLDLYHGHYYGGLNLKLYKENPMRRQP